MSSYRVVWTGQARRDLAAIWLNSSDRNAVARAQAICDQGLAFDPERHGEFLAEGLWAITVAPLRLSFEIDGARSRVLVTNVNRVA